jgi:hypothetical protein
MELVVFLEIIGVCTVNDVRRNPSDSDAGNRVVVGISSLNALHARATGQVTLVDRRALSGDVNLDVPDLTATIAGAEKLLGRSLGTPIGGADCAKPGAGREMSSANVSAATRDFITICKPHTT